MFTANSPDGIPISYLELLRWMKDMQTLMETLAHGRPGMQVLQGHLRILE